MCYILHLEALYLDVYKNVHEYSSQYCKGVSDKSLWIKNLRVLVIRMLYKSWFCLDCVFRMILLVIYICTFCSSRVMSLFLWVRIWLHVCGVYVHLWALVTKIIYVLVGCWILLPLRSSLISARIHSCDWTSMQVI